MLGIVVRQVFESAPIFRPSSTSDCIVSFLKLPGTGGTQSSGIATNRNSTSPGMLRSTSSEAYAVRRRSFSMVARSMIDRPRLARSIHSRLALGPCGKSWLFTITQMRITGGFLPGFARSHRCSTLLGCDWSRTAQMFAVAPPST